MIKVCFLNVYGSPYLLDTLFTVGSPILCQQNSEKKYIDEMQLLHAEVRKHGIANGRHKHITSNKAHL